MAANAGETRVKRCKVRFKRVLWGNSEPAGLQEALLACRRLVLEKVFEIVKTLVIPHPSGKIRIARHYGPGPITVIPQMGGQGRLIRAQSDHIPAHGQREAAGQQGGKGIVSRGARHHCIGENDALRRQAIHGGGNSLPVPQKAHMIRPQAVNGDEQQRGGFGS